MKKVYIGICQAGLIAVDENGNFAGKEIFEKVPEKTAEKMIAFESGKETEELSRLKEKFKDSEIITKQPNPASAYIEKNFLDIARREFKDMSEFNNYIKEVGAAVSRKKISGLQKRDKLMIQAISSVNDLDKILNSMIERIREWYGLHYPELRIEDHEKFAKTVADYGNREFVPGFSRSMGMELDENDTEALKSYAKRIAELYALRKELEKYIEETAEKEIPSIKALLGGLLSARILALAGGLEKLAKMPASTVQLLGSEKSLFKFLKARGNKNAKCPKFGILFTHPDVCGSRKEIQGKVARLLASKLTIAARADFYSKENKGKELKDDYDRKFKGIANRPQPQN